MSTNESQHAAFSGMLDITKVSSATVEMVVEETCQEAAAKQAAVDAIERDSTLSREQRQDAVHNIMDGNMRWLCDLHDSNDEFAKYIHGAAHQMIDACNKVAERNGEGACKTVIFSFMQMMSFGFRLAGAHLETQALERTVV